MTGQAWSTAGGVNRTVDFRQFVLPIQSGNANGRAEWKLQYQNNAGGWNEGLEYFNSTQEGVTVPRLKVNGYGEINANNSSTVDTLQTLNIVNPSGSVSH